MNPANNALTTSAAGRAMIESFEGLSLTAYQDSVGVWTIGYGSTAGVHEGMTITRAQADQMLAADLKTAESAVKRLVTRPLKQNEFDALVSFTFNVGAGNLAKSGLLRAVNSSANDAYHEFLPWNQAGGRVLPGLVRRRAAEARMFQGEGQ